MTADISSAAFYNVCDQLTPTLLIDEAATAGQKSNLLHLLRAGFTPGVVALRKNQSFKSYGAKVVSWIELPDDAALDSRCIVVPLQESTRSLKSVTDPDFQKAAEDLQKKLLKYRFDKLNSLTLPSVEGADRLHGRTRDLYEALALANGDPNSCKQLVNAFEILQEQNSEPLSPNQAAVLRTLFSLVHSSQYYNDNQFTSVGDLAGFVNYELKSRGERFCVNPRAVGAVLKSFGIPTHRHSWGCKIWVTRREEERIHDLVFRYGLDNSFDPPAPHPSSPYHLEIVRRMTHANPVEHCIAEILIVFL